jgi:hypothetical protein
VLTGALFLLAPVLTNPEMIPEEYRTRARDAVERLYRQPSSTSEPMPASDRPNSPSEPRVESVQPKNAKETTTLSGPNDHEPNNPYQQKASPADERGRWIDPRYEHLPKAKTKRTQTR